MLPSSHSPAVTSTASACNSSSPSVPASSNPFTKNQIFYQWILSRRSAGASLATLLTQLRLPRLFPSDFESAYGDADSEDLLMQKLLSWVGAKEKEGKECCEMIRVLSDQNDLMPGIPFGVWVTACERNHVLTDRIREILPPSPSSSASASASASAPASASASSTSENSQSSQIQDGKEESEEEDESDSEPDPFEELTEALPVLVNLPEQAQVQGWRILRELSGNVPYGVQRVFSEYTLDAVAAYIKSKIAAGANGGNDGLKIIILGGAGMSVAAGIPDFRSPTGLYAQLKECRELPTPESVFSRDFFLTNPKPFFAVTRKILPGGFAATSLHYFMKLLEQKGVLIRIYTQNIDGLERVAGLSEDKLVECHGTFSVSTCLNCQAKYDLSFLRAQLADPSVDVATCTVPGCSGVVKPHIVLFGEPLPERLFRILSTTNEFQECNLLLICGTSLQVHPFARLVGLVNDSCPRVLINNQLVGHRVGFRYGQASNYRDVHLGGDCQDTVLALVEKLGWTQEFDAVKKTGKAK